MAEKFLSLEQVSVQMGGRWLLDNLDLTINRGEQWAITGPSGSGKTVLAQTLSGRYHHTGRIGYYFGAGSGKPAIEIGPEGGAKAGHSHRIVLVDQQHRFKNRPGTTDLYYQQRFNASDADQTITVEQELREYTVMEGPAAEEWLDNLHIRPLLSRPLIQLSNGENKRVQLAIALLEEPELLILDNPFLGLDTAGRRLLHQIINGLAAKGIQVLLLMTGMQELPEAITHVARLENGRWGFRGKKEDFHPEKDAGKVVRLDAGVLAEIRGLPGKIAGKTKNDAADDFAMAIKMVNVTVQYGEKTLLKAINWEVKRGERWNVSGPNGAGKSTLLSLITADNPQAYANEIWLFDRRRGSGETIWEIKQRIGFVSPELHLYFDYSANCFEVIASGLFDTIGLFRPLTGEQEACVSLWMKLLSLTELRRKRLAELSTGQQRMVLLARALIKNPPMLILDEPCQGLDDEQTAYFREFINLLCEAFGTTLIYVSHYPQEIPDCVNLYLKLDNGEVVK
ncbi:MAG TPA: ATP-binding cassette domain-containing protein [Puia sp.]|nr:ATP-binding cassette domain-containing protein [Puia sp.]